MADVKPTQELLRLINGYQVSHAISLAASLGIADRLKDGAATIDALATATASDVTALYRVMRALAALGLFREEPNRSFSLTALGEPLCEDAPGSLRSWALFVNRPYIAQAWQRFQDAVAAGATAFDLAHGDGVWSYRAAHPDESAIFDHAMTALSRGIPEAVRAAYDFKSFATIADIGGGEGLLLSGILQAHPAARGILFDAPQVAARGAAKMRALGLDDRCEVVGGDFFQSIPVRADLYLMKAVLHDWDDAAAIRILARCRETIGSQCRLLILERLIGPPNAQPDAKFSDLNMMVMTGGRERSLEEFESLLAAAAFRLEAAIPTGTRLSILDCRPI